MKKHIGKKKEYPEYVCACCGVKRVDFQRHVPVGKTRTAYCQICRDRTIHTRID